MARATAPRIPDPLVEAALRLADALAPIDSHGQTRTPKRCWPKRPTPISPTYGLILNARARHDQDAIRLRIKQYVRPPTCTASESIAACSTTTVRVAPRADIARAPPFVPGVNTGDQFGCHSLSEIE